MSSELTKLKRARLQRSRKVKITLFCKNGFSQIAFELRKIVTYFCQHRVPNAETRRNMFAICTICMQYVYNMCIRSMYETHRNTDLKSSISEFDLRSRSREVTCRAKQVILHISRCVCASWVLCELDADSKSDIKNVEFDKKKWQQAPINPRRAGGASRRPPP